MYRHLLAFCGTTVLFAAGAAAQSTSSTPVVRPPALVKLEAQAAAEIATPVVPPGRAVEAKKVAETSVAVRRATWVIERLLPAQPEGVAVLKLAELKTGSRGWIEMTGEVVKTAEGMLVVRSPGTDGVTFAIPAAADSTTVKTIDLRGEFAVDKSIALDGRDVFVLKEVAVAKGLDREQVAVLDAARKRLEEAKAAHAQAIAVLKDTRKRAEDKVMEATRADAVKQIPIPATADVEDQIKLKAKQADLALKLAKPELEKIAMLYADTPVIEPIRK